eukprot:scaffold149_cov315-Pinguiococcus_pyrenoidosus.AAC.53
MDVWPRDPLQQHSRQQSHAAHDAGQGDLARRRNLLGRELRQEWQSDQAQARRRQAGGLEHLGAVGKWRCRSIPLRNRSKLPSRRR